MKKKIYDIPLMMFVVVIVLCIVGIIVGSICDLQISEAFVDMSDPVGMFVETIGQAFGYSLAPIGAVILCKGMWQYRNIFSKIGGIALLVIAVVLATYFLGDSLDESEQIYGYLWPTVTAYLIALAIICGEALLAWIFISSDNKRGLVVLGIIIILSFLAQLLIVKLLKSVNCRPRYRYLIDSSYNTSGETFRSWWEFSPFSASDDFHYSWPSGHSACIAQVFLFPAITPYLRWKHKGQKTLSIVVSSVLVLFVTVYRVRFGAHYLSDISFGVLFAVIFMLIIMYVTRAVEKAIARHLGAGPEQEQDALHESLTENI